MQEIKIRFYSKYLNKYVIPDDSIFVGALKDPKMVKELYTGLKDKNGKNIYEGDVLEDQYGNRAVVLWHQGNAEFLLNDVVEYNQGNFDEPAYVISNVWVEHVVIDNIHDNPQLLGGYS